MNPARPQPHGGALRPAQPGQRGANGNGGRRRGTPNKLTIERVEQEIRRIALFDPRKLIRKTDSYRVAGKRVAATFTLKDIAELPDDVAACIQSFDVVTQNLEAGDDQQETVVKVRWYDKRPMLELCAKHFKWVEPEQNAASLDVLVQRLQNARSISLTQTTVTASLPEAPSAPTIDAAPPRELPLLDAENDRDE